jgi:hypothetical protein
MDSHNKDSYVLAVDAEFLANSEPDSEPANETQEKWSGENYNASEL